jgi:hypothetical protein
MTYQAEASREHDWDEEVPLDHVGVADHAPKFNE